MKKSATILGRSFYYFSNLSVSKQASKSKLIPLLIRENSQKRSSATLFIQGFLSKSSTVADFQEWTSAQQRIEMRPSQQKWRGDVFGLDWECGSLKKALPSINNLPILPFPITAAYQLYRAFRFSRIASLPAFATTATIESITQFSVRLYHQFQVTENNAAVHGENLAESIQKLNSEGYKRVRIFAHSLGCRQVLIALRHLKEEELPVEIHLLAPAFTDDHLATAMKIKSNWQSRSRIWWADNDIILSLGFRGFAGGDSAIGSSGLANELKDGYILKGGKIENISQHLSFLQVHGSYAQSLDRFIA